MKRLLLALFATSLLGLAATPASTGTESPVKVLCWNEQYPQKGRANIKATPSKCSLFRRGFDYEAAGAVHLRRLDWKGWGDKTAVAKGQYAEPMDLDDPWKDITVKLRKPIEKCGRTVYSKAVFSVPGSKGHGGFPIWIC